MSPSAWPANAWPRTTVKAPATALSSATAPPIASARRTAALAKKPGARIAALSSCTARSDDLDGRPVLVTVRGGVLGLAGAGDDDHAPVDAQHVDVMAVEGAEHLRAHDLLD